MTLLVEKGFRQEDFASLHPGGKLGKRLMRVERLMHAGKQCPIVRADTRMRDVIYEMSSKGLGMTCVVDAQRPAARHHHRRRPAAAHGARVGEIAHMTADDLMTRNPVTIRPTRWRSRR